MAGVNQAIAENNNNNMSLPQRGSTSSSRSSISRRTPQQQLSQIERSVTHLLVATKLLLETLTSWSRGAATESEVSDVYVRLGYEFNIACRAFNAIGVETHDLGPVPELLRTILEDTLSQDASQASLDRFLPRIRDIIINLLQGLKRKQTRLRTRNSRDATDMIAADQLMRAASRNGSREVPTEELPPRTSSRGENIPQDHFSNSDSSLSSATAQALPVAPPAAYVPESSYPSDDMSTPPLPSNQFANTNSNHTTANNNNHFPTPPNPSSKPEPQDALLALQRGGDLERRASRRFSTYQINKQLGGAASGIVIPPAQNSPLPNRGREVRESINAVRQRGSQIYNRSKTERKLVGSGDDASPNRQVPQRISEEKALPVRQPTFDNEGNAVASATLSGPLETPIIITPAASTSDHVPTRQTSKKSLLESSPSPSQHFAREESPQPGKPLTLFLQFKSKVKKIVLEEGSTDLTIPNLQLHFIEKFQWNTHNDGIDLPEIYLQDSVSGVRYELEDLTDIKNNSVLVLNFEPLDEVKRHFDDGISGLRKVVEGIKTTIDNQQSSIQRINDRQQETQKEIATFASMPPPTRKSSMQTPGKVPTFGSDQLSEIQSLRRNLAVLRQSYSSLVSDVEASMSEVRTKSKAVKSAAVTAALPNMSGDSGRAYIKESLHGALQKDQTSILDRVEDVQDSIEDLRKDVVLRGVRPLPRQLEQVAKDMSNATSDLKKLEAYVGKENPLWNKIWKQELQAVCDDREVLRETEALISDLKHDLEEAEKTFRLVEEACKQQNAMAANGPTITRTNSAGIPNVALRSNGNPEEAKHGLLVEVKGLTIDHDSRVEAIERAERQRQKELEGRSDDVFKKELGSFVEEGKLKKSGGVEEAERLRKVKDDRIRREVWERMNGGVPPVPPLPAGMEGQGSPIASPVEGVNGVNGTAEAVASATPAALASKADGGPAGEEGELV
jgi:hypothetical protein